MELPTNATYADADADAAQLAAIDAGAVVTLLRIPRNASDALWLNPTAVKYIEAQDFVVIISMVGKRALRKSWLLNAIATTAVSEGLVEPQNSHGQRASAVNASTAFFVGNSHLPGTTNIDMKVVGRSKHGVVILLGERVRATCLW